MQRVTMVRYATRPERADENEALALAVFAELRAAAPEGVSYALFRNGSEFVHLFVNAGADDATAITELMSFRIYGREIIARCEAPPEQMRMSLHLLDSYGLAAPGR